MVHIHPCISQPENSRLNVVSAQLHRLKYKLNQAFLGFKSSLKQLGRSYLENCNKFFCLVNPEEKAAASRIRKLHVFWKESISVLAETISPFLFHH